MTEEVSLQLLHQRIRNRIIEQLECLADGDGYIFRHDADDYFEAFFGWMPAEDQEPLRNMTMTSQELAAVEQVRTLMMRACTSNPSPWTEEELLSSGWLNRIADPAAAARDLLEARGRFSEVVEDDTAAVLRHH